MAARACKIISPVRWYGGKGNLAAWLLPYIPYANVYCEAYAGAGSLFWRRSPSPVEVYNDLDKELINFMRVLQSPGKACRLKFRLRSTLCSLDEFCLALKKDGDEVDRAWAFFVRQNQGFSGIAQSKGNWNRAFVSRRGRAHMVSQWQTRLAFLEWWQRRIARAQIDCRDALTVIKYWDSPDTVFYLDPPYVSGTRAKGSKNNYAHECSNIHHRKLVELLLGLEGAVALSGYRHPIYEPLVEAGWQLKTKQTACHAAGKVRGTKLQGVGSGLKEVPREECLWRNQRCLDMIWKRRT